MEPPTAMMTETQQYIEKIQAIADAANTSRSSPPSRKSSLISAFAATTISAAALTTTDTRQSFMSSAERSQSTNRETTSEEQQPQSAQEQHPQTQAQLAQPGQLPEGADRQVLQRSMPNDGTSNQGPSSSDMSDSKLSRFYHAMGSSDSAQAERREAEERARREAEERARRASEGK